MKAAVPVACLAALVITGVNVALVLPREAAAHADVVQRLHAGDEERLELQWISENREELVRQRDTYRRQSSQARAIGTADEVLAGLEDAVRAAASARGVEVTMTREAPTTRGFYEELPVRIGLAGPSAAVMATLDELEIALPASQPTRLAITTTREAGGVRVSAELGLKAFRVITQPPFVRPLPGPRELGMQDGVDLVFADLTLPPRPSPLPKIEPHDELPVPAPVVVGRDPFVPKAP